MKEEISKYDKKYRGKELIGFVNYKTFEVIVQEYIDSLLTPALDMLQKTVDVIGQTFLSASKHHFGEFFNLDQMAQGLIEDIKVRQADIVEDQIRLQFRMERRVFCQDRIYSNVLGRVREETFSPMLKAPLGVNTSNNTSVVSSINEIGVHLKAYFLEASQRLANQIPLIIQHFLLHEYSECLQKSMMQALQDKDRYAWLLQEQDGTTAKRMFLKEKLHRLEQARKALCKFYRS